METALIGREHSVRMLRSRLERARASHGGLVLVTGEAGIGKTSLVRSAVDEARESGGMLVVHGTCWDSDSTPGFWPWTQAVRSLRRGASAAEWEAAATAAGGALSVLLGEGASAGEALRFELFDAVTTLLTVMSQSRPVTVVLEDLHWADAASLSLLEFTAQHTWYERLLVIGTYRDVEVQRPDHPLRPLLPRLAAKATTLALTGLTPPQVAELAARTVGVRPDAATTAGMCERTGGNPYFVEETARLWSAGQPVAAVAPGVRAVVHRRLALLGEPTVRLLGAAAVLGRRFGRRTLARTAGSTEPQTTGLLGEAVAAGLLEPSAADAYVFTHDLVRETLYDGLAEDRRRHLHAAAVRALRDTAGAGDRARPTDLARHAYFAGPDLDADEAVDILVAAGRHAVSRLASEEAVAHYRRALERLGTADPRRHVLLALDLGAELQLLGEHERSWLVYEDAATLASGTGDAGLVGRVALTLHHADGRGDGTGLKTRALREAHRALVPGPRPAADGPGNPDAGPVDEVARRVVAAARAAGDDDALHLGLWARLHAVWAPGTAEQRVRVAGELMEVSRRRADVWMEHLAASMRWVALLELDDPGFLRQFSDTVAGADACGLPRTSMISVIDRSVVYAFMGRFPEADDLLAQTLALSGTHANYYQYFVGHHRWALAVLRGSFPEAEQAYRAMRGQDHLYTEVLAGITALERGTAPHGPVPWPGGGPCDDSVLERGIAPLRVRLQAQSAAASRDPARCGQAHAVLAPYRGQWLVSLFGWDISGPAALWSGLLHTAEEQWDAAVRDLTTAARSADRLHARPWSVRARTELARALLARAGHDDTNRAAALLHETEAEARELGMPHLAERARSLAPSPAPHPGRQLDHPEREFVRNGAVWRLRYAGRTVHVPDAKGLADLHTLLGLPGQDIPAVRLLYPDSAPLAAAAGALGSDLVLDEEAKTRYRQRLELLDDEIDRAAVRGDGHTVAEYDSERKALLAELRKASGLAGRSRRLGDETDRARKNVTARIRDTLRRLKEHHPELASHLQATVSTGAMCRYAPDCEVRWRL
ncbi:ATP-binding protein [Streptomyces albofaciens JCM 4342]|uniref:ATP-binding protein n=1 Tax=Streptomyces albofaciens TaxID=66866 RepID=UPI0012384DB4|nr:AAA family ATPase [Streptomyces albofaciens]KAA6212128.1 ATP-binding protein [Streptomyces albofaciens JCM 4342]